MAVLTGVEMATFTKGKKGTPYIYGAKGANGPISQSQVNSLARSYPNIFTSSYLNKIKSKKLVGKVCTDCSGLISWYTRKVLGSAQLYSNAYARLPISEWRKFAIGTVVWKSGHVGVYIGDGLVAEAKGIDYGTIISKITDTRWSYGLTFSWINYDIQNPIASETIEYKGKNPYPVPSGSIRKGQSGISVKWLQWELNEAGYKIAIDGSFGTNTYNALIKFQSSAKLKVDGICGDLTKRALTTDHASNPFKTPTATVKLHSTGENVKWVQWELNESGANLTIDGSFGTNTYNALIKFQKDHNLEVDGKCGPKTKEALIKAK